MNFVNRIKAQPVLDSATGSADRNSAIVDTRGAVGVAFVLHFGAVAGGATGAVKLQGGHLADGSDMADLIGSSLAFTAADANEVFSIEVGHSQFRYLRMVVDKDGANNATEAAIAYLHSSDSEPVEQPAEVAVLHLHAPEQGAA